MTIKKYHTMGRPKKYDDDFYKMILENHKTLSLTKLAKYYNVSVSTVTRWLQKGKEIYGTSKS